MGWLAPVGVAAPDGTRVAYSSWEWYLDIDRSRSTSSQGIEDGQPIGAPSIRMVDVTTGSADLFEEGAFSVAWRGDGALAYFKGEVVDHRNNEAYLGSVLVRPTPDAPPEV
jgi:hypothetical protein